MSGDLCDLGSHGRHLLRRRWRQTELLLKRVVAGRSVLLVTFDVEVDLTTDGRRSGGEDAADVAAGVRLLGVVDVEGDVGRGHGHREAHALGELVLAEADVT